MRNLILVCMAVLAIGTGGCQVFNTGVPGSGVIQTRSFPASNFTGVKISGVGSLNVSMGDTESVTIKTDDNLLDLMKVEVVDGVLKIGQSENISPTDGIEITVVTKDLNSLRISGAGSAILNNIVTKDLEVKSSGAGSFEGNGEVENLTVTLSGAGSADIQELKAKNLKVKISGAGSAEVFASESLDAKVSGVGSIECKGSPKTVNKSVSGLGSIDVQ